MAMRSLTNLEQVETKPKKTKQGRGQHTKYSATSRNKAKKKYRGQGKKWTAGLVIPNWSGVEIIMERIMVMKSTISWLIFPVLNVMHLFLCTTNQQKHIFSNK